MAPSIGVNLRVTGQCNQGGRKYMEDTFSVAYQQTDDESDLEYAYFGIFDGHGGREAAIFAKEHLMNFIVGQKNFWCDQDENVLKAIKDGFVATHMAMWKQVGSWPQTVSGLPSTSGTTASVAFIRKGKMYVGHVGDSAIVLGYKEPDGKHYLAQPLTKDHKPESPMEKKRIEEMGGSVINKSGVQRVVWNRPRIGHKGPIRRSTQIDQIPFLAVARSLGDLWSYDYYYKQFIVSPEPDVSVVTIDPKRDRCIILATDGLWNMLSPKEAVQIIESAEQENERNFLNCVSLQIGCKPWMNPSRLLVEHALQLWSLRKKRADNTSVVTVMLDPPGPPKSEVLLRRRMLMKLRPREEQEAGSSTEREWWDQRSRVMVTHEPSPQVQSDSCVTPSMWWPKQPSHDMSGRPAPPSLPPKTKHSTRQPVCTAECGSTVGGWTRQTAGSASHPVHRPTDQDRHDGQTAESLPFDASRPLLPPPTKIAETELNQEMLRSAPTPPLPCTDEDLNLQSTLCCKGPAVTGSKPASLQRIPRCDWGGGHAARDFSKSISSFEQNSCHEGLGGSRHAPDRHPEKSSYSLLSQMAPPPSYSVDSNKALVAQVHDGTNTFAQNVGHVLRSAKQEVEDCTGNNKNLGSGEAILGAKRKSPNSRQEIFSLAAKHPRVNQSRGSAWGLCRLGDDSSEHVTRSRVRLRKAQA